MPSTSEIPPVIFSLPKEKPSLQSLPREIFLTILDHTPLPDLLKSRAVSRQWWTDALHAAAVRLNARHYDEHEWDNEQLRALLSADGEWYGEHLTEAGLVCVGVRGIDCGPELEESSDSSDQDDAKDPVKDMEKVRFVFEPKKDQWPVLGYFVNSEGRMDLSINHTPIMTIENSTFLADDVIQQGQGWELACVLRDRPDIEPGSPSAGGLPHWWHGRRIWGLPSEVYYCDVEVTKLELSIGWLLRLCS